LSVKCPYCSGIFDVGTVEEMPRGIKSAHAHTRQPGTLDEPVKLVRPASNEKWISTCWDRVAHEGNGDDPMTYTVQGLPR
jgi:hypothetical protein